MSESPYPYSMPGRTSRVESPSDMTFEFLGVFGSLGKGIDVLGWVGKGIDVLGWGIVRNDSLREGILPGNKKKKSKAGIGPEPVVVTLYVHTDSCVVELYPVADDNIALVLASHILVCQWSERCDIKVVKHVSEPPGDGRCSRGKREAHSRCKRCGDDREQSGNDLVRGRVRRALWHVPRSCGPVVWNESGGNEGAAGLLPRQSIDVIWIWRGYLREGLIEHETTITVFEAQQMGEKHWHKTYLRSNSFFLLPGPACLAYHSNAVKIPNHSGISNDLQDFIRAFEDSKKIHA
ncbi:hypothetical protein BDZ89DRAFT_1043578 [Hymenopellis radicata]|nr:hypothetical protein BDZ89DRAFT_1043578 [Hymenopellis radicata]